MRQQGIVTLVLSTLWLLLGVSIGMLITTLSKGTQTFEWITFHLAGVDLSLAFRFDTLSAPMFAMVATLAVVIGHYSLRYLDAEERQPYFYRYLLGLIGAVSALVLANNLVMFFAMWVLTSYNLHRLLLYYPDRPNAQKAAIKKQIVSRLGDVAILAAIGLIFSVYGTTNLSELFLASSQISSPILHETIGLLLVLGAITKSAQFPFHSWLPETMETPTPVSALMHAGVINAGGFLIIRFSPILEGTMLAHGLLILIGAWTAVYASLVMITQNNIKSKLAYSTISQMGIMLFACGLGAYGIALFHIIAHSFYKSHAFLSTGQLIEESKKVGFKLSQPTPMGIATVTVLGLGLIWAGYRAWDGIYLSGFAYAAVMLIALAQNRLAAISVGFSKPAVYGSVASLLLVGLAGYGLIEMGMGQLLAGIVPDISTTHALAAGNITTIVFAFGLFIAGFVISGQLMNPKSEIAKRVYVHLWNAGYFSHISHRMMAAIPNQSSSTTRV